MPFAAMLIATMSSALPVLAAAASKGDRDGDGVVANDQCPDRAELVNQTADTDGCPDTVIVQLGGVVVDAVSGAPVTADVSIRGPAGEKKLLAVQQYQWATGAVGTFQIEVQATGYIPRHATISLLRGQALRLEWALIRMP